jgi:hypothetical protein
MAEDYSARLADDADPLRALLRAARQWRVAPTVFLGQRKTVTTYEYDQAGRIVRATTTDWTQADTDLVWALDQYEAGLCPGGDHHLDVTSKPEHEDAYRLHERFRCHYCKARAVAAEAEEDQAGLVTTFRLDPEVVAKNREPVPPLPVELQQ